MVAIIPEHPDLSGASRRVRQALTALIERYEIGRQAIAETLTNCGRRKYGAHAVKAFAAEDKASKSHVYDSRLIAASYTPEELDNLINLAVNYNTVIGPSHAIELARVKDRKLRAELEEAVAFDGLSAREIHKRVEQLHAEIKQEQRR